MKNIDFEKRVNQLKDEILYLRHLLDQAQIPYKKFFDVDDQYLQNTSNVNSFTHQSDTAINIEKITPKHASFFYSIFKGRRDVYSKRSGKPNVKTGKTGYFTQCWNFWKDGLCPKKEGKSISCNECKNQKYKELLGRDIYAHLLGLKDDCSDVIGLYSTFPDDTCNFLIFDFDNHDQQDTNDFNNKIDGDYIAEVNAMRSICKNNDVPIVVERSRSGKGAHIWLFFSEPISAELARKFGSALLTKGAETVNLKNFKYYDRMIPAQDHLPVNKKSGKQGLGNLVALPLQGRAVKCGNSAFVDENWNVYKDQWLILKNIIKIDKNFIQRKVDEWSNDGVLGLLSTLSDFSFSDTKDSELVKPWERKQISFDRSDVSSSLKLTISDKLYIDIENVKPRMINMLRRKAAFSNPEFYKKMNMGFSTHGIPRIIFCGYDESHYLCLPRGLMENLTKQLDEENIPYNINDFRNGGKHINVSFKGVLYEEQQNAVDMMLKYDNGILAATTSFGKTVVGAYIIAHRKVNTLILVHNTEILKNWEDDLNKFLIIDEELPTYSTKTGIVKIRKNIIGTLFSGRKSLNGIIDIAIFSSLGKKDNIDPIVQNYGMVIMDECHHGAAQSVVDVISAVKARFIYGLTATPKREDGMEQKVYMQFGPIRYRYTAKDRAQKQGIDHFVIPRFTRLVSNFELSITEAYKSVVSCEIRNMQIVHDVEACVSDGRTPLVLSKYKEHTSILYTLLKDKADYVYLLQGGIKNSEKDRIRKEIKDLPINKTAILIAIDKYIGEGFNFPRLDTLMLTMPVAWEGNIEQFAGRLHRDYESKNNVIIYDYIDSHIKVLEKMYHKRIRAYKKIGYEISENFSKPAESCNAIFDSKTYLYTYECDINNANSEVVISSPLLSKHKVNSFLKSIERLQEKGIKFVVITMDSKDHLSEYKDSIQDSISKLIQNGVNVITQKNVYGHFAIIDDEIVWYGSLNFLSKEKDDDNLIRLKNKNIASEIKIFSAKN